MSAKLKSAVTVVFFTLMLAALAGCDPEPSPTADQAPTATAQVVPTSTASPTPTATARAGSTDFHSKSHSYSHPPSQ